MTRPRFAWRAMVSVLVACSFIMLLFSGIILFASPPGRVANWTNWTLVGLRKTEWTALHIWFSAMFLAVSVFHVFYNWRPLVSYFKDRLTRRMGFRWEWAVALGICAGVYAGVRSNVPPFSSLLAFNEELKMSWDKPAERAPIPHAELLALNELVQKAGLEMAVVAPKLEAKGIKGYSGETIVQEIADRNNLSAKELYDIILSAAPAAAGKGGHGKGQGGGGGPGWKTLEQFCQEEGIALADAVARLKAKGFQVDPKLTLRELAVNNGFERPYELLEAIRGSASAQ